MFADGAATEIAKATAMLVATPPALIPNSRARLKTPTSTKVTITEGHVSSAHESADNHRDRAAHGEGCHRDRADAVGTAAISDRRAEAAEARPRSPRQLEELGH